VPPVLRTPSRAAAHHPHGWPSSRVHRVHGDDVTIAWPQPRSTAVTRFRPAVPLLLSGCPNWACFPPVPAFGVRPVVAVAHFQGVHRRSFRHCCSRLHPLLPSRRRGGCRSKHVPPAPPLGPPTRAPASSGCLIDRNLVCPPPIRARSTSSSLVQQAARSSSFWANLTAVRMRGTSNP